MSEKERFDFRDVEFGISCGTLLSHYGSKDRGNTIYVKYWVGCGSMRVPAYDNEALESLNKSGPYRSGRGYGDGTGYGLGRSMMIKANGKSYAAITGKAIRPPEAIRDFNTRAAIREAHL